MTVNLSALAGAGQQFFDASGNPLSGGKLYSYQAGTTTPQTTYTDVNGAVPHTNPIILDSAGRVPTGEIWVTAGSNYKFVLNNSNDVLQATWNNITGINGTGIATAASAVSFTGFNGQVGTVQDLADNDGSDWIGFEPNGANAVARSAQDKMRDVVSVKDFGAVGDGVADDTAAIQAAITYVLASKLSLYAPAGTYLMSTGNISITAPITLFGDGSQATIFKFPSGAGNAFAVAQGTAVNGLQLQGFQILGAYGGKVGLKLGDGNINNSTTDSTFSDIRIANMSTGLQTTYAWSNVYSNVRCQSCTKPASFDSQTNSSAFNGCDFVTYDTAMTFSNCEGLVFNAANISNCGSATYGFTMFQSNITINQPYFENTPTNIALVGASGESTLSQLVINGGIYGDGIIVVGRNQTYIDVSGMRPPVAGGTTGLRINTPAESPVRYANVNVSPAGLNLFPAIAPILDVDYKKPRLLAGAAGGSVRTLDIDREYSVVTQTTSGNGLTLTSSLEVGQQYVFEYALRVVAGMTEGPSIRVGAFTRQDFSVPADTDAWEVRRIYFVAADTTMRLLFQGSLQWKAVRIYKNIPTQYLEISSPDEKPVWWFSSAPSTGTWAVGDIVWNTAPAAGGTPGWVCTTAGTPGTWKAMANVAA